MTLNTIDIAGIVGSIEEDYTYENKRTGKSETFYILTLLVPRLSENYDEVPFNVSKKLLMSSKVAVGNKVAITGSMRTRNYTNAETGQRHVKVYGFAEDLFLLEDAEYEEIDNKNIVRMVATVCKPPVYRTTGSGRTITDVMVAVNRQCYRKCTKANGTQKVRKSYYFPCLAWGADAKAAKNLQVGDVISLTGRFQSRKYRRKSDALSDTHIAYEISMLDFEIVEQEPDGNDNDNAMTA